MAKLSPDYCHSLLLTMSDEEKRKFLRTLEERPLLPATSSEPTSSTPAGSGTAATAPASSSAAKTAHQLSNPMGENLATEDYGDTTSTAIPAAPSSVLQEATPPSAPQAKASAPAEPEPPAKAQQICCKAARCTRCFPVTKDGRVPGSTASFAEAVCSLFPHRSGVRQRIHARLAQRFVPSLPSQGRDLQLQLRMEAGYTQLLIKSQLYICKM